MSLGFLTSFESSVHGSQTKWRSQFEEAVVHNQWDPERSIDGKKPAHRSIQFGLSRAVIREFTDDWILEINTFKHRMLEACATSGDDFSLVLNVVPEDKTVQVVAAGKKDASRSRLGEPIGEPYVFLGL